MDVRTSMTEVDNFPFPHRVGIRWPGKRKAVRREYIEVGPNVRLHVTDVGEGRPIVLLAGWPLSDEMYEYQYADLARHRFRVIGLTLRGFGNSDKPEGAYDYHTHATDVGKVLEHLNIEGAILGGFSMAGAIAIRYASLFSCARISKLALFGAAAPLWTQRWDFPYNLPRSAVDDLIALNNTNRRKFVSDFAENSSAKGTLLSKGLCGWLKALALSGSSYATGQCLIAMRDTDLRNDLARITIPTLILHGRKDKICSFDLAEQMDAGISNSQVVAFEESGHSLFLEETHKFNTELIRFAEMT